MDRYGGMNPMSVMSFFLDDGLDDVVNMMVFYSISLFTQVDNWTSGTGIDGLVLELVTNRFESFWIFFRVGMTFM